VLSSVTWHGIKGARRSPAQYRQTFTAVRNEIKQTQDSINPLTPTFATWVQL